MIAGEPGTGIPLFFTLQKVGGHNSRRKKAGYAHMSKFPLQLARDAKKKQLREGSLRTYVKTTFSRCDKYEGKTQAKPGADINLGVYPSIQNVSCLTVFPFPVFLVPDSRLRFFPIRAFSFSRLTPSFFPTHASFFPDSRLPFF